MKLFIISLFFIGLNINAQTNLPDVSIANIEGKKISFKTDFSEKEN
jgi:hypothetical protein